ncbi:hypothetical protein ACPTGO_31455, partial [Pseudomonas aeruginosa]|uniref:hypothetical protein n=1 Tax=Pseudomonas aeruginosa TaxID=287 RepID=UPI003CC522FF
LQTTDAAFRFPLMSVRCARLVSGFGGRPDVCMEALVAAIPAVAQFPIQKAERFQELVVNT